MSNKKNSLESGLSDIVEISKVLNRHQNSIRYAIKKNIVKPKKVFHGGRPKLMFDFSDYIKLKEYFYRNKEGYYVLGQENRGTFGIDFDRELRELEAQENGQHTESEKKVR